MTSYSYEGEFDLSIVIWVIIGLNGMTPVKNAVITSGAAWKVGNGDIDTSRIAYRGGYFFI
jgi:hypothetical protein